MIECEAILKTWGHSIGFVIPKGLAKRGKFRPKQKVRALITPVARVTVRDVFGKLKRWKKSAGRISAEVDRDLDSKFF